MKKALVTGASGFIGGHLVSQLCQHGYHVRCLVRHNSPRQRLEQLPVEYVYGDITDEQAVRQAVLSVDCVFHLAGKVCALTQKEMLRVNADAVGTLLKACSTHSSPPVVVLVSSLAAAGPVNLGAVRHEHDEPRPISVYGRSKLVGERQARLWASSLPVTIIRPGIVFGPYDPGMKSVVEPIYRWRIHLNPGLRSPLLSFIHVHDLCRLLIAAAERGERLPAADDHQGTGIYFAAVHDEYRTYIQLGEIVATELLANRPLQVLRVPHPLAWLVGWVNEWISFMRGRPHLLNRDKIREGTAPSWACSGEKIRRHFQFTPPQPLDDQLRATAAWYVQSGWISQRGR